MKFGFRDFVRRIDRAHNQLGHTLGWRFLYTPQRTFRPHASLVFVGLNPGGGLHEKPVPSVEAGNAYRIEKWGRQGGMSTLQKQVCSLYSHIASAMRHTDGDSLMDATLLANFCPFRSPNWAALANRDGSLEFCRELWAELLVNIRPRVLITLGSVASRELSRLLLIRGLSRGTGDRVPTGWGAVACTLETFTADEGETLLVCLPHLSRFTVFTRPSHESWMKGILTPISQHLR